MKTYTAVVERDPDTGVYVGYVPGFPGAHSQGETLDELNRNLKEVIALSASTTDELETFHCVVRLVSSERRPHCR